MTDSAKIYNQNREQYAKETIETLTSFFEQTYRQEIFSIRGEQFKSDMELLKIRLKTKLFELQEGEDRAAAYKSFMLSTVNAASGKALAKTQVLRERYKKIFDRKPSEFTDSYFELYGEKMDEGAMQAGVDAVLNEELIFSLQGIEGEQAGIVDEFGASMRSTNLNRRLIVNGPQLFGLMHDYIEWSMDEDNSRSEEDIDALWNIFIKHIPELELTEYEYYLNLLSKEESINQLLELELVGEKPHILEHLALDIPTPEVTHDSIIPILHSLIEQLKNAVAFHNPKIASIIIQRIQKVLVAYRPTNDQMKGIGDDDELELMQLMELMELEPELSEDGEPLSKYEIVHLSIATIAGIMDQARFAVGDEVEERLNKYLRGTPEYIARVSEAEQRDKQQKAIEKFINTISTNIKERGRYSRRNELQIVDFAQKDFVTQSVENGLLRFNAKTARAAGELIAFWDKNDLGRFADPTNVLNGTADEIRIFHNFQDAVWDYIKDDVWNDSKINEALDYIWLVFQQLGVSFEKVQSSYFTKQFVGLRSEVYTKVMYKRRNFDIKNSGERTVTLDQWGVDMEIQYTLANSPVEYVQVKTAKKGGPTREYIPDEHDPSTVLVFDKDGNFVERIPLIDFQILIKDNEHDRTYEKLMRSCNEDGLSWRWVYMNKY